MHERIIFEKIKPGDVPGYRRAKMDLMEMRLGAARSEASCNAKVLAAHEKFDAAKTALKQAKRYAKLCKKEVVEANSDMEKATATARAIGVSLTEKSNFGSGT